MSLLLGLTTALGCALTDDPDVDDGLTTVSDETTGDEAEQTTEGDEPECVDSSDCPQYSYCEQGMCVNGEEPEYEECYEDADCPEGMLCVDNECIGAQLLEPCEPIELASTEVFTLTYPHDFDVGNVDGQPGDEIVAYHQGEIVSIAAGSPTASPHPVPYGGVHDVLLLQADGDGATDLIMAGTTGSLGLHTFLGDGTGTFSYLGARNFDPEIYWLARAEGPSADALVGAAPGGQADYDHQLFFDALANQPSLTLPSRANPITGDLDGDGIDELVTVIGYGAEVEIWTREGESYVLTETINCYIEEFGAGAPVIGDVDADGLGEVVCLAVTDDDVTAVSLWSRAMAGLELTRQPTVLIDGSIGGGGDRTGVVVDLQGDGAPELALVNGRFLQLGDEGNFGCQGNLGVEFEQAGDLDDDGRADLVGVDWNDVVWAHEAL